MHPLPRIRAGGAARDEFGGEAGEQVVDLPAAPVQQRVHLGALGHALPGLVAVDGVGGHRGLVTFEEYDVIGVVTEHPGGQ
ncbi:hypothetical protein GCM10009863_61610 [Streptomyces axinellae]|uniref:Uncharacterized protein n=1 Tax=Streptomyces axinellae TaxID=552788 RepID=A0ABP6DC29_9ACTN